MQLMRGKYVISSANHATSSINSRCCQAVLSADPKALKIFTDYFLPGYVAFHVAARRRYKLDDLGLDQTSNVPPM